jgi:uncharacterized protein
MPAFDRRRRERCLPAPLAHGFQTFCRADAAAHDRDRRRRRCRPQPERRARPDRRAEIPVEETPHVTRCANLGAVALAKCRGQHTEVVMDDRTRTELEAATFRRLVAHLRERTDVQNIDLMNLAGFCRNCLSKWYRAEAEERDLVLSDAEAREIVYGMPYDEWRRKYQREATAQQKAAFAAQQQH